MATANVSPNTPGDQIDIHEARREFFSELCRFADNELTELQGCQRAIWAMATAAGEGVEVDAQAIWYLSDKLREAVAAIAAWHAMQVKAGYYPAATLDRLAASKLLAKFEEMWDRLGGGWDGEGGEQILAREVRAELTQLAGRV